MDERGLWLESRQTQPAVELGATRQDVLALIKEAGKSGDIDLIVATEKTLLTTDLTLYANNGAMATSLKTALQEANAAENGIPLVRDPTLYRAIDTGLGHHRSRSAGEAEQAR